MHLTTLLKGSGILLLTVSVAAQPGGRERRSLRFFQRDDRNHDGKVTREEFRGRPALFDRLDRNGDGVLTEDEMKQPAEAKRTQRGQRKCAIPPTIGDVSYGPHERNVLNVWQAESETPTPVLVWIHGGGFRSGDKGNVQGRLIEALRSAGISVVSINYRLSHQEIAPAQFTDVARAIQFIRSKAGEWNLDPKRMAAGGGSAGAGLSQWLAFHDDMADPDSPDPVLRQSTRLSCVLTLNGQTTYDPRVIKQIIPGKAYADKALQQLFGYDVAKLDDLPADKYKLFEECSPMTHISAGDPPILMLYGGSADPAEAEANISKGIHHPLFGYALKKKMDALGIECTVKTETRMDPDLLVEFLKKHLAAGAP